MERRVLLIHIVFALSFVCVVSYDTSAAHPPGHGRISVIIVSASSRGAPKQKSAIRYTGNNCPISSFPSKTVTVTVIISQTQRKDKNDTPQKCQEGLSPRDM